MLYCLVIIKVCVARRSIFRNRQNFAHRLELLAGQLTQALSDTDSLYAVANRGMNKAMEKLSWDKRADEIIKLIESL